jgi:starch-binding outer membrane protein, SusD/RagB family
MKNKGKYFYITLIIATFLFTSCKKYFEVDTSDKNTLEKTFSTIDGFKNALAGTYNKMYDYYTTNFYVYADVAGNMTDLRKVGAGTMVEQFNFISAPEDEVAAVGYIWRKALVAIVNANNIINNAPGFLEKNSGNKADIDLIKAQALFMRALAHFDLCRVYAQPYNYTADAGHLGVPIVLVNPAPEDAVKRATVKEVYTQIITDLKTAEELYGSATMPSEYFASKKAAQALLARVYLYSENWDEAISYATKVIDNSSLAYGNDYATMFNGLIPGVEAIFRLNGFQRSKTLGNLYALSDPTYIPADTLMKLFTNVNDIRLLQFKVSPTNPSKYYTKKWTITASYDASTERYDPMVLRASEMYFIRAEAYLAKNNTQAASDDLKVIIGRALAQPPATVILTATDKTILDKTITVERAKELCFEGHNFFDIVRRKQNLVRGTTTASTVKTINYPSDYFVLPIPQAEIDANPGMVGNPTVNK